MHGLFDFKVSQFLSKLKQQKSHSFTPRSLIFKLQQKVLKFNDICVTSSSPKTDLDTNFLNLDNRCFS